MGAPQVLQTQNIPINNQNNPITAVGSPTVRPLTPAENNPSAVTTANGTVRTTTALRCQGSLSLGVEYGMETHRVKFC